MLFNLFVVLDQYPDVERPVLRAQTRTFKYVLGEPKESPAKLTLLETGEAIGVLQARREDDSPSLRFAQHYVVQPTC